MKSILIALAITLLCASVAYAWPGGCNACTKCAPAPQVCAPAACAPAACAPAACGSEEPQRRHLFGHRADRLARRLARHSR
jgi:hypothetical protein